MWRILGQAVRLVLRNLLMALRISVGPLVLLTIVTQGTGQLMSGGFFDGGTMLLLDILSALILSWVAVAWHRFILREEGQTNLLPPIAGPEIFQHLGWSVVLGLGSMVLGWAVDPLLWTIFAPLGGWSANLGPPLVLLLLLSYLGLRFGLVLPAAALGRPMTLPGSWEVTRPLAWPILGLALINVAALGLGGMVLPVLMGSLLMGDLALLLSYGGPMLWATLAAASALGWLSTMLSLS